MNNLIRLRLIGYNCTVLNTMCVIIMRQCFVNMTAVLITIVKYGEQSIVFAS